MNSRYQFLYKKYCPELNLAKSSSKSKDTIKVNIGKDDESNETVAKNELQIADWYLCLFGLISFYVIDCKAFEIKTNVSNFDCVLLLKVNLRS